MRVIRVTSVQVYGSRYLSDQTHYSGYASRTRSSLADVFSYSALDSCILLVSLDTTIWKLSVTNCGFRFTP